MKRIQKILEFSNKTDDYYLGFTSLSYNDFLVSLYHFDMALIKDPKNYQLKIGKSAALIGLNRTNESRKILFELEPISQDKKIIYKLLGDSYNADGDYSRTVDYYLMALKYYSDEQDKIDLKVLLDTCEIESSGKFDSPWISITNKDAKWKYCEVSLNRGWGIRIVMTYSTQN